MSDRFITVWLIIFTVALLLLLYVDYLHWKGVTTQSFSLRAEASVMSALLITAVVLPVLARLYKR